MSDRADIDDYATGRWPAAVRVLVLLGAPPRHAEALAETAVGAFLSRCAREEWLDLDVTLVAEVVDAWETDRTAWWHQAPGGVPDGDLPDDVREALDLLDRLSPTQRARTLAEAVAGLTPDQVDDALGPAAPSPLPVSWHDDLPRLAATLPVGDPRTNRARARHDQRRRTERRRTLAGLGVGLVVVTGVVALALRAIDPQPGPDASGATPTPTATAASTAPAAPRAAPAYTGPELPPVTWYDGRLVHLPDRTVPVSDVVAMVRAGSGVVATDADGRVLLVRAGGTVEVLGRTTPGALVVADPVAADVAWVDAGSGAVVVRPLRADVSYSVPARGAAVVAIDDRTVYVDSDRGQPLVRLAGYVVLEAPAGLLDVAGGTQARQRDEDLIAVSTGHQASGVAGRDGTLSDDGDHLLTRDLVASGAPLRSVVDLDSATPLPLDLGAGALVRDAAFGAGGSGGPEGTVTFVVEERNGIQYPPDRPRSRGFIPGYTLVVCDLAQVACLGGVVLYGEDAEPLLAH